MVDSLYLFDEEFTRSELCIKLVGWLRKNTNAEELGGAAWCTIDFHSKILFSFQNTNAIIITFISNIFWQNDDVTTFRSSEILIIGSWETINVN